ncbi:MAG TPA: adenylate/guanylate cyclase domain-containing protein [Egibacteraceae bacterium]|nr:adenylate/guanylate cyclase domain-containing protein [Egibacteraceae bacterium]
MGACGGCGEQNPARARYCLACGRPLSDAPAGGEQRKLVTVVFADVVDSTGLGERRDAEAVRGLLLRYFDAMRAVIVRHGGTVEKFVGDAVMAIFGLPQVHEDDALRAVRAAQDMRAELERLNADLHPAWGVGLQMRVGVNSGEVMAGMPGDATLATGDAVNLAARLEQAAGPGEIVLAPATYRLVRDAVVAHEGEPLRLKGKAEPVTPWRLQEVIAGAPGRARRIDTTFVGRVPERGFLDWAFHRVSRERTCHLVTILGPAGVGKSRLVTEFLDSLGQRAKVVTGRCLPYGEGITFWPVAEIVRQATNITEADPPDVASAKLYAALGEGEAARRVASELAGLIGLREPSTGDPAWAVRKGLEALARNRPVVIVVDDLQWAEPTLLDLVEHVADWSRDAPILVLGVGRPELLDRRPGWGGGKVNATSLLLEPLSEDDAGALLDALVDDAELGEEARRRLIVTAGGNPLFLEELLAMLVDEGMVGDHASGRLVDALEHLPLPDTIHALLTARLDNVEPPERDTLDRASVVGEVFELAAAAALTPPPDRPTVPSRVRTLVRKELLRIERSVDEEVYAFRHLLMRDAVYAALPKLARAELHERVADWVIAVADNRTGEYDEIVGYHLEQGAKHLRDLRPDDPGADILAARAAAHLAVGGRRALGRGDMPAATSLLRRAADLSPAGEGERGKVLLDLVKALIEVGDMTGAGKAVEEAVAAADAVGDVAARTQAHLSRLYLASSVDLAGWAEEATREAEHAIEVLTPLGDDLGLAQAWSLLCEVRYLRGNVAAAEEALRRCAEHGRRAGNAREEADTACGLTWTAVDGPLPVTEGIARCEETLRRFDGHRAVEARVFRALALLRAMLGEFEAARAHLACSVEAFTDLGQRYWLAATDETAGRMALLAGDRAGGEEAFRAAAHQLEAMGDAAYLPGVLASLSMVLGEDKADEAAALVERCRASAEPDDVMAQILWRLADAQRRLRAGDAPSAVTLAAEAAVIADHTDLRNLQGDALATLGGAQALVGRREAAHATLVRALGCYQRKGNTVSADRARADLARLGPAAGTSARADAG